MKNELIYWGWLTLGLMPYSHSKWMILRDFSPESIYDMVTSGENPGFSPLELKKLKNLSLNQVEYVLEECLNDGINVYCPENSSYPQKLLDIPNPPSMIFSYGDLGAVDFNLAVAIIGSREADDYALSCANRLSYELANKGVTIISGFARGIDSAGHSGALRCEGQTVAVLGCGINYDYPRGSRKFKERIAENGAVISEYLPNAQPNRENFKIRNRIISGLSNGVAVISAGMRSGTLNTVSHGNTQGKDIFALPPKDIYDENYKGNISLLRDGAIPIYSYEDILKNLRSDTLY